MGSALWSPVMETPLETLLRRIDAYLKETGTTATTFGIKVANNPNLLPRLRTGKIMLRTMDKVVKFLDRHDARAAKKAA